jgi:hypothetical protein
MADKDGSSVVPSASRLKLTARQEEARKQLRTQRHTLLVGGSRSGKTTLLVHEIAERALLFKNSRHAILRLHANAARGAIALDTVPKVFRVGFPTEPLTRHRTEGYFSLKNGSEIWVAGLDDQDRVEKILGKEYATIFLNEWAGAAHETMLLAREAGNAITFTDAPVLDDYAAVTGFDPAKPETDQGTDVQQAAEYRRTTGVIDAHGSRHRIAAYLALEPGNLQHLYQATYLFGAAGIGLQLPATAPEQSKRGQTWDVVAGAPIDGGHYVPLVGRQAAGLHVISWGMDQVMTETFLKQYCDEAIAYVSLECLVNQKSPEGFSYADLISDLAALS